MNPTQNKYTQVLRDSQARAQVRVQTQPELQAVDTDATVLGNAPRPVSGQAGFVPHIFRTRAYTGPRMASGQNTTAGGNPSALNRGMTIGKRIKIEKAARLCATGLYPDKTVADHLGITQVYLSQLKTTKEFQSAAMAVMTGVLSRANEDALSTIEDRREELSAMVPMALLRLRNLALSRNENIALKANMEILDRDGHLAKVSKSSIELKKPEDLNEATKTANSILDILRPHIQANPNSPDSDPIGAIAPGFTVSAADAKIQIDSMNENINEQTLEQIDLSKSSVQ